MDKAYRALMALGVMAMLLTLTACGAKYSYKKVSMDGSTCELTIYSAREIKAADLLLDSDCAIMGGASGITNSKEAFAVMKVLAEKIP